jgi:plasmid stability protein
MKQKVVTLLEEDVMRRAKRRAADEGRPLSDLIQDALEKYLTAGLPEPARREAAFQLFCEQPIKLSPEQFKAVLDHDSWDAWGQ